MKFSGSYFFQLYNNFQVFSCFTFIFQTYFRGVDYSLRPSIVMHTAQTRVKEGKTLKSVSALKNLMPHSSTLTVTPNLLNTEATGVVMLLLIKTICAILLKTITQGWIREVPVGVVLMQLERHAICACTAFSHGTPTYTCARYRVCLILPNTSIVLQCCYIHISDPVSLKLLATGAKFWVLYSICWENFWIFTSFFG